MPHADALMPLVAVLIGWPAVAASLALMAVGVTTQRSGMMTAGVIAALPFLAYLALAPRFRWLAPLVIGLNIAAVFAMQRRRRLTRLCS